jgi:hypothetical protein
MGMQRAYPSAEWGLLVSRVLQDEDIPFPSGFLRNLMNMAQSRSDLYGLLEVLYANKEGDENSKRQLSSKTNQSQQQSLVYGLSEAEAFAAGKSKSRGLFLYSISILFNVERCTR